MTLATASDPNEVMAGAIESVLEINRPPVAVTAVAATEGRQSAAGRQPAESSWEAFLAASSADLVSLFESMLRRIVRRRTRDIPDWLKPASSTVKPPRLVTLTEFAHKRSQLVAELDQGPVLLTRHGTVVAALVAVEAGSFESATSAAAFEWADLDEQEHRADSHEAGSEDEPVPLGSPLGAFGMSARSRPEAAAGPA